MPLQVWVNHPDFPMKFEMKIRTIDACIASDIFKLNANGVVTLNCCCRHRQDWRFNADYISEKSLRGGILITNETIRHAEALCYEVKSVQEVTEILTILPEDVQRKRSE
jgi:hypothetical protein